MIAALRIAVEDRVRSRNPEILQYILTHYTDYYHAHIKPKLLYKEQDSPLPVRDRKGRYLVRKRT